MSFRKNGYGPIDRFCSKHPRFGVPNLMKTLVFTQIAVFVIDLICCLMAGLPAGSRVFVQYLEFVPLYIFRGEVWRILTWLVVPNSGNVFYLLLGCYFYYWIASTLERQWGTARFNLFYFGGAILSVVFGLLLGLAQQELTRTYSAMDLSYYLNLSIFLVLATIFGENRVLLFFVVPIKMKWLALIDVVLIIVGAVEWVQAGVWMMAFVPVASLINYFIFTWPFWRQKIGFARRRGDPQVVNFKKAQHQAQRNERAQQAQGYRHKCAVCGITDAQDPDMEFRYCSKCDGYHCYCIKHIDNHIHIREE